MFFLPLFKMANMFIKLLPRCAADKLPMQLHKTASTIGFIKKSLSKTLYQRLRKLKEHI